MKLIDTHAHLDFPQIHERLGEVLESAREAGVRRVVAIGASRGVESNVRALEIARAHPEALRCTAGIHPHDASIWTEEVFAIIADKFAELPEVVAIGETGLDYFYDKAPKDLQHEAFRCQLQLAQKVRKPVVIHTREAEEDTLRILREEGATSGILHCFTGSRALAEAALELGFHISFSGIVTFKNGRELLEIAASVPLDRILVETDSPYLAPIPHRGKTNEPGYVRHTAEAIAHARGMALEDFAQCTWDNASRLFGWPE